MGHKEQVRGNIEPKPRRRLEEFQPDRHARIAELATRNDQRILHLICQLETGVNPKGQPLESLLIDAGLQNVLASPNDLFGMSKEWHRLGIDRFEIEFLNRKDRRLMRSILNEQMRERDAYLSEIIANSPSLTRMFGTFRTIISGIPDTIEAKRSPFLAETLAKRTTAVKFGVGSVDPYLSQSSADTRLDPAFAHRMRRDYMKRTIWYADEATKKQKQRKLTRHEIVNLLQTVATEETLHCFEDFAKRTWEGVVFSLDEEPKLVPKLTFDTVRRLRKNVQGKSHSFVIEEETGTLSLVEENNVYKNTLSFHNNLVLSTWASLHRNINRTGQWSRDDKKAYTELTMRLNMINLLSSQADELAKHNAAIPALGAQILEETHQGKMLIYRINQYISFIKTSPHNFIDVAAPIYRVSPDYDYHRERANWSERNIEEYVKWMLHSNDTIQLPRLFHRLKNENNNQKKSGRKGNNDPDRFSTAIAAPFLAAAIAGITVYEQARKAGTYLSTYIPHQYEKVSRTLVSLQHSDVIKNEKPFYVIPPKENKGKVNLIEELSTYPEGVLEFEEYLLPVDASISQEIYITSQKPQLVARDPDGVLSARIYSPDFADLKSLQIKSHEEIFEYQKDYTIEYEATGHYRAAFTEFGRKRLFDHNFLITTTVGIDTKERDDAPKRIPAIALADTDRILDFAARLSKKGYIVLFESIKKLVDDVNQHPDAILLSSDLAEIFRNSMQYSLENELEQPTENSSEQDFWYLPSPDEAGLAPVQCAQASKLFQEFLSYVVPEGKFYDSNLIPHRHQEAVGVAFGSSHADTRGRIGNFRIQHDVTPMLAPGDNHKIHVKPQQLLDEVVQKHEASKAALPPEVAFEHHLDRVSSEIDLVTERYGIQMEEVAPKGKDGKVQANFQFPIALLEVSETIRRVQAELAVILNDERSQKDIQKRLLSERETWLLAYRFHTDQDPLVRRQFEATFGSFWQHAHIPIGFIDSMIGLLQK